MPDEVKLTHVLSQAPAPAPAPLVVDYEALVARVRVATIPGTAIAQDAAALGALDHVFLPALIAALKQGA